MTPLRRALMLKLAASVTPLAVGVSLIVKKADYSVAAGDTLSAIARRHGTTVPALTHLNGIKDPNILRIGQRLRLPSATAPSSPASQPAPTTSTAPVLRRNNWGNVRYYKNVKWHGLDPKGLKDGDMAVFNRPEDGARAALRTLITLGKRHGFTLNKTIPHYSPVTENNTPRHIQNISRLSGLTPDQVLDPANNQQMTNLLRGVIGAESGQSFARRFTPQQYAEIVRRSRISL